MISRLLLCALLLTALPAAHAGVKVVVDGLDGEEKDNVMQRLAINDTADRGDLDDVLIQRLHAQAESDIRTALQPFGYYSPTIKSELSGEAPHELAAPRRRHGSEHAKGFSGGCDDFVDLLDGGCRKAGQRRAVHGGANDEGRAASEDPALADAHGGDAVAEPDALESGARVTHGRRARSNERRS